MVDADALCVSRGGGVTESRSRFVCAVITVLDVVSGEVLLGDVEIPGRLKCVRSCLCQNTPRWRYACPDSGAPQARAVVRPMGRRRGEIHGGAAGLRASSSSEAPLKAFFLLAAIRCLPC